MGLTVDIRKNMPGFTLETRFSMEEGQTLGLLGGSGSGKSMTLKCIAGLLRPDEGHIELDGRVLFDSASGVDLPPQRRCTGYLFQNYALFPHMTVTQNILCGMRACKHKKKTDEILERFYLSELRNRYPAQLSGGQQQRVALARIVVSEPRVLMLDEPFSALDAYLRGEMQRTFSGMLQEFSGSALVVSHDRDEIYHLCDQIAIYHQGRLDQLGVKTEVFTQPRTRAAAVLTGCRNVLTAHPSRRNTLSVDGWGVSLQTQESVGAQTIAVGIRAHHFRAVKGPGENVIACKIESVTEGPFEMIVYLRPTSGQELLCWKTEKSVFDIVRNQSVIFLQVDPGAVLPLAGLRGKGIQHAEMCDCLYDAMR